MGFIKEFKEFAMRGNVLDMAIGIIIGGAFGKIVSSLVSDIIMPPIGLLIGGVNFTNLKFVLKHAVIENGNTVSQEVAINYGNFIQVIFDFTIIAFAIFILLKAVNQFTHKQNESAETPAPPADVQLLSEIRDLLKKN